MNKEQARRMIAELFTGPFNRDRYKYFLRNLCNDYELRDGHYTGNLIPEAFRDHIRQYWRIGKYVDPQGDELDLLVVQVKTMEKLERARSALRNFSVTRLKRFEKDACLTAFYAEDDQGKDWRFSFIKIEHEAYRDAKNKVKLREELTPARRYSYLVGVHENSHTASRQLLPLLEMDRTDPLIENIEEAFSIEKVTEEFFDQYKMLFTRLVEHLKGQDYFRRIAVGEREAQVTRFTKKLLGQIVFLYFLQKKGWLGAAKTGRWGEGSKRFMRERFEAMDSGGNYYQDFLRYLFYEALGDERKNQQDPSYYERFDCGIPFLNGGLFEADYNWKKESLELPNTLFHNREKTAGGDTGTGILDIFDRYNFTVKEDEPLEKEVAVDPEMLGKVFENMLEVTEKKFQGAFYTPREIVHYMCQESLIHYLDNKLNIGDKQKDDLGILIRKGRMTLENDRRVNANGCETPTYKYQLPEPLRKHAQEIDKALSEIKVCDPAIGSGAFPVGLMHEIVSARLALAPHRNDDEMPTIYELKRHVIANNLYGVDTDPSAIDIARLRLWLSLIVDEDDFNQIEALPNLDYKIFRGDSLLGIDIDLFNGADFDTLEKKKAEYFSTTDHQQKTVLSEEIEALIEQITEGRQMFDFKVYFSEVWHQNGGFDVVVGNPPYVQIQKFKGNPVQKEWEKQNYKCFTKTGDIYCLFYEKGSRLLRDKGLLCYITSNKWMRAAYGEKLRRFLLKDTAVRQLIDFGDSPIFSEATTYTNVMLFEKHPQTEPPLVWDISSAYSTGMSLNQMLEKNSGGTALFEEDGFVITSPKMAAVKQRIESLGKPIKEWNISINRGVLTGLNEAFIIDGKKKDELIAADSKSAEIIKPILRGRDIKRYRSDFADLWIISTHNGFDNIPPVDIKEYPAIKAHLDIYHDQLKQRQDKGVTPYNLRNCAYLEEFSKEKLVYAEIVPNAAFFYDFSGMYIEATAFVLTGEYVKLLTAMLNSQLLMFAFKFFYAGGNLLGDTFRYKKVFLQKLPVVIPSSPTMDYLESLVDYVQIARHSELKLQSVYFEQLIDALVYELYFPEEFKSAQKPVCSEIGKLIQFTNEQSNKERLAVIQREFDRLYDPKHPVRNAVGTLDSIEVVRTVQEALKR